MEPSEIDLETLKRRLYEFFLPKEEILFAYVFGSAVTGRVTPLSDIDIAAFIDNKKVNEEGHPYGYEAALTSELMGLLKTNKVDLVLFNEASPLLKHRVFSRGVKVFDRDPNLEGKFFVRSLHQYFDTDALRKIQWSYLKNRLRSLGPHPQHG